MKLLKIFLFNFKKDRIKASGRKKAPSTLKRNERPTLDESSDFIFNDKTIEIEQSTSNQNISTNKAENVDNQPKPKISLIDELKSKTEKNKQEIKEKEEVKKNSMDSIFDNDPLADDIFNVKKSNIFNI